MNYRLGLTILQLYILLAHGGDFDHIIGYYAFLFWTVNNAILAIPPNYYTSHYAPGFLEHVFVAFFVYGTDGFPLFDYKRTPSITLLLLLEFAISTFFITRSLYRGSLYLSRCLFYYLYKDMLREEGPNMV